jgi:hypothetical protein
MMISKMKQVLILFFLSMLIISCGRKQESESDSNPESKAFALERENFFNSLKNPDEVVDQLVAGLTEFDASILNDSEHFYRYADNNIKAAANLGIYISDLNYCILFKRNEETKKYFQATYELSKAIQIEKGILEFLMKRYETNIERSDSVKLVVNQLFSESTLGLQGTDRERLAGIAMAGYQIENLHLALTTLESFPETLTDRQIQSQQLLLNFIVDQRGKFEVIYNFVRANSDPLDPNQNPNYPFFDHALRELIGVYRNVTEENPQVNELKEKVDAIRIKIINL